MIFASLPYRILHEFQIPLYNQMRERDAAFYAGLEKATNQKPGDVRSDIYFLGHVLYEMLTGATLMPVTKDRQARMMARRYMDVEDALRKNGPALGVPPAVMRVLSKMVAFDPVQRYQTPTQLVEALQACRLETGSADGAAAAAAARAPAGPKTVFVVEKSEKLQDAFREKFKAAGYRVLLSIDPGQAARRYQQQPYHAAIIDARTVGRDGLAAYHDVLRAADAAGMEVVAVLLLSEDQAAWKREARKDAHGAVLVDPGISMKQLLQALEAPSKKDA